jgi:large subunit ribosomal protein L10
MLNKKDKKEIIDSLAKEFSKQKTVVFFDYAGLKVNQFRKLREDLREKEINCQVVKKTLADLALEKAGFTKVKTEKMPGQLALALGYQDEVIPTKILYNFSKKEQVIQMMGGLINGEYFDQEGITKLSQLPSREELLAKLVGSVSSPLSGLVGVLSGNLIKLTLILKQRMINCKQ